MHLSTKEMKFWSERNSVLWSDRGLSTARNYSTGSLSLSLSLGPYKPAAPLLNKELRTIWYCPLDENEGTGTSKGILATILVGNRVETCFGE